MCSTRTAPMYSVEMLFNGEKYEKRGQDIEEAILSLKPEILHTEVYVTVKHGKQMAERKLNLQQGKRLFRDESFREVFMTNLLLV